MLNQTHKIFAYVILSMTIATSVRAESIRITSYNTGFLEKGGVDLVPCVRERLAPQVAAVMGSASISPRDKSFAILLQEVWTYPAYMAYRRAALARGLFVTPATYLDVKTNGQMIITNLNVQAAYFEPFKSESYAGRGILSIEVATSRGSLVIANVHTSYSDANGFLPAHRSQLKEITRYFWPHSRRSSLIIGGDFNAGGKMSFRFEKYDSKSVIWDGAVVPAFDALGMRSIGNQNTVTWDEEGNRLVSDPTRAIRIMNYFDHGYIGWDQHSSRLDQIFASIPMRATASGRTMLQKVRLPFTCTGHADREGKMHLSDHYGVLAEFEI